MLDFTIFGRITEFFVGIVLSVFAVKMNFSFKKITHLGVFFVFLFIYILSVIKPVSGYGTDCITGKIINTLLIPVLGIALVFYGLIKEKTLISRLLSSKLFVLLGKSSYAFYLIHLGLVPNILSQISQNLFFQFIALNCIAVCLYYFIEKPLHSYIQKTWVLG